MAKRTRRDSTPKVGTKVKVDFGVRETLATVIEDRGNVGLGGRRILRVRLEIRDVAEPIEFEVPADDVRPAA